ncbi:hypothetical protein A2U01_0108662, partial [Trifolium medium]|nr:hypothetical protein [Trifolium medium]
LVPARGAADECSYCARRSSWWIGLRWRSGSGAGRDLEIL